MKPASPKARRPRLQHFRRGAVVGGSVVLCLGIGLTACSSSTEATSSGGSGKVSYPSTLDFGAMVPLSGVDIAIGTESSAAINEAVATINNSGELGSTKLKPIYRDNPGTPEAAVTNINALSSINHVPFSFTTFSSATVAIAPLATQQQMVLMNPGAGTTRFKNLSPYLFSDIPLGDLQAEAMLKYAYQDLHIKSLAGVYSQDAQGNTFETFLPNYWKSLGGTYVGTTNVTTTQTDFTTAVTQVKNEKPQAVYFGFFGSGQGTLIKQAAAQGLSPTWLGSTSWANTGAIDIAGANANGVYSSQVVLQKGNKTAANWSAVYKKAVGSVPSSFAELSYSGMQVFAAVLMQLRSEGKAYTGPNIRQEMLKLTFNTVNGPMTFNKDGSAQVPVAITVYKNGTFNTLATFTGGKITPGS